MAEFRHVTLILWLNIQETKHRFITNNSFRDSLWLKFKFDQVKIVTFFADFNTKINMNSNGTPYSETKKKNLILSKSFS